MITSIKSLVFVLTLTIVSIAFCKNSLSQEKTNKELDFVVQSEHLLEKLKKHSISSEESYFLAQNLISECQEMIKNLEQDRSTEAWSAKNSLFECGGLERKIKVYEKNKKLEELRSSSIDARVGEIGLGENFLNANLFLSTGPYSGVSKWVPFGVWLSKIYENSDTPVVKNISVRKANDGSLGVSIKYEGKPAMVFLFRMEADELYLTWFGDLQKIHQIVRQSDNTSVSLLMIRLAGMEEYM